MTGADGISLRLNRNGETGLYVDCRCGFQIAIPGHPTMHLPRLKDDQATECDSLIQLADLPVTLRLRLMDLPAPAVKVSFAASFVRMLCDGHCHPGWPMEIDEVSVPERTRWRVEAAATGRFLLAEPDHEGNDGQTVLLLYRNGQIMYIAQRYSIKRVPWIARSLLMSALHSALVWDPKVKPSSVPELWPPSRYLLPGIRAIVPALPAETISTLQRAFAQLPVSDKHLLASRLERLLRGTEPPISSMDGKLPELRKFLTEGSQHLPFLSIYLGDILAGIETFHDVRGCAILLLHILSFRPAEFADG